MNVKKWNFSYNMTGKQEWKQNIVETISLWGAMGLLWYSYLSIIGEHFPDYLPVDWEITLVFVLVLWLGYEWPKKYLKKFTIPCHVLSVAIPVGYIMSNWENIMDGVVGLAASYLPHFNSYYKSSYFLGSPMESANTAIVFTAISMLFWGLAWTLAYGWKKRVLLVIFPLLALVAELVVGLSPMGNGLFIAFLGAMLLLTLGNDSVVQKIATVVCVCLALNVTGVLFEDKMEESFIRQQKQALLKWQSSINLKNINLANLFQFDFHFNLEQLNNRTPQYTGKTILEIETTKQPVASMYVKGFYGTSYDNGNWNYDDSYFRDACREAGVSTEEATLELFQLPYMRLGGNLDDIISSSALVGRNIEYTITYIGATGDVAYVPYLSDYTSLDEEYTLMGDYLLKKAVWDSSISGFAINVRSELSDWWDLAGENDTTELLNQLSDAYLYVPEEAVEFLAQASAEIERIAEKKIQSDETNVYYSGKNLTENHRRIRYGEAVKLYLAEQMCYSLKLDSLPAGRDPIDYALNESHEGYCMHFASAATLLLRQAGVPARYVSGYTVNSGAFIKDDATGRYKATVGDFMAHAWVEVYLENIGWVPLEVTPGSSLTSLPTQGQINSWESISEQNRQENSEEEQPSQSEDTEETEGTEGSEETEETENSQSQQDNPQNSQQETPSESEEDDTNNPDGTGIGNGTGSLGEGLKILGIAGAIVLLLAVMVLAVRSVFIRYNNVLRDEVERNMTRKAVKRINRRMYVILLLRNPRLWFARKLSDNIYEEELKKQYPNVSAEMWETYMDIVKKNHYSSEKISVEEMQCCYDCYVTCMHKKK